VRDFENDVIASVAPALLLVGRAGATLQFHNVELAIPFRDFPCSGAMVFAWD